MTAGYELVAGLIGLFGVAAAILWTTERVAAVIGGRWTSALLLLVLPLAVSVAVSVSVWDELVWWQRLLCPLSGPPLTLALLFAGFMALNPADAIALVCMGCRNIWARLRASK